MQVRVRPDIRCVVEDPESGTPTALTPDMAFDDDSPIVRAYPWAFQTVTGSVEQATARPGERRPVTRS